MTDIDATILAEIEEIAVSLREVRENESRLIDQRRAKVREGKNNNVSIAAMARAAKVSRQALIKELQEVPA